MNAVSGKRDVHCNISHGHLYLFYEKKKQNKKNCLSEKNEILKVENVLCKRLLHYLLSSHLA